MNAERHFVEERLAVRRSDLQPVERCGRCRGSGRVMARPGLPSVLCPACHGRCWLTDEDCWAGTLDHGMLFRDSTFATVTDDKMGMSRHAGDPAEDIRQDNQIRSYCWLLMRHYPQIEFADGYLRFWYYGAKNFLTATFSKRELEEDVTAWVESQFAAYDRQYNENGKKPWPAQAHQSVCRWCPMGYTCPLADGLIQLGGQL